MLQDEIRAQIEDDKAKENSLQIGGKKKERESRARDRG